MINYFFAIIAWVFFFFSLVCMAYIINTDMKLTRVQKALLEKKGVDVYGKFPHWCFIFILCSSYLVAYYFY